MPIDWSKYLRLTLTAFRSIGWVRDVIDRLFPPETLYVRGRHLYDLKREKVVLRGINLPLLDDWGFPTSDTLAELEKTGANCVRIQRYIDYPKNPKRPDEVRGPYSLADLDGFLTRCGNFNIIPILDLHDVTCEADANLVNTQLMPWWTSNAVKTILQKHERYLIVNFANELGFVSNSLDDVPEQPKLSKYQLAYQQAITDFRATGLRMPIMIDAPDCGTSIKSMTWIGKSLVQHDPLRNVLLSVHAYWATLQYDGFAEIDAAVQSNIPLVFGEIANKQFANDDQCYYDIDGTNVKNPPTYITPSGSLFTYQALLARLAQDEIGWLAWSWWKDGCEDRQMTSDGTFSGLTQYGTDIVTNGSYGLKNGMFSAKRASL